MTERKKSGRERPRSKCTLYLLVVAAPTHSVSANRPVSRRGAKKPLPSSMSRVHATSYTSMEGSLPCLPKRFEAAAVAVNVNRFSALLRLFSFCGFGVTGAGEARTLVLPRHVGRGDVSLP